MPAELEELAADLEVTGLAAWSRLYDQVSGHAGLRPRAARRGAAPRAGLARAEPPRRRARRAAPGRAARREPRLGGAGRRRRRLLERDRRHAARALPAPRRALPRAGPLRRRHHARHPRRDAAAVGERRELPRRYLRRKAALLGRARLGFQDLEAPLPAAPAPRVSFDEARERVLAAFAAHHAGAGGVRRAAPSRAAGSTGRRAPASGRAASAAPRPSSASRASS